MRAWLASTDALVTATILMWSPILLWVPPVQVDTLTVGVAVALWFAGFGLDVGRHVVKRKAGQL